MTAKRAGARLAERSEFSRGVLTLHHGSRCARRLVDDAEHGCPSRAGSRCPMRRSLVVSSRATRKFCSLSPASPWTRRQSASLALLSSRRRPFERDQLATCMRLSDSIHAAMKSSREKQATSRRRRIHARPPTSERAPAPGPRTSPL